MQKSQRHFFGSLLTALSFVLLFAVSVLPAGAVVIKDNFYPTVVPQCYADVTAYTNATTGYTDLTGATCAFVPTRNDPTTAAGGLVGAKADLIKVTASLAASKATALTGTCGVFVNGAVLATTERLTYFTELGSELTLLALVPNTTVGAQTIKIQCKSADTNILTVSAGFFIVEEIVRY